MAQKKILLSSVWNGNWNETSLGRIKSNQIKFLCDT